MSLSAAQLVGGTQTELVATFKVMGIPRIKVLAVQTGSGSQQTLAHGLSVTPLAVNIILSEATTGLAIPFQSAVPDATNIYVTAVNAKTYNVWILY